MVRELRALGERSLKFLRLLYLAAARGNDHAVESGGWVKKSTFRRQVRRVEALGRSPPAGQVVPIAPVPAIQRILSNQVHPAR
jgi:hypothetical protein